jgi:hypothetical protein
MKKLHKKLRKVAEHIDLTNANQTRHLKNLALACDDFELAVEMRGFERAAEQGLAESSRFTTTPEPGSNLDKVLNRSGWLFTTNPLKNSEKVESTMLSEQDKEEPTLLVNSIKTPDGTILTSRHRHDYVCHEDIVTGTRYCIDGGDSYSRLVPGGSFVDLSVYSDDPFEKIREGLERGSRGKDFDQPFKWVKLKDMSDAWLGELILWIEDNQPNNKYKKYYLQEIEYRKEHNIKVEE